MFGRKSVFNDLCYDIVTRLQDNFRDIKRIYIIAEYPKKNKEYISHIKTLFEDCYYYNKNLVSHRLNYIKRNETLIDKSDFCLFYYDCNYLVDKGTKSGTHIAYNYAVKKNKKIINVYE